MRFIIVMIILIATISCETKKPTPPPFRQFEMFYSDTWNTAFSIKFGQGDTLWVKQEFVSGRGSNTDTLLQANTAYYAVLHLPEKDALYASMREMPFDSYDSAYQDVSVHDGRMMHFHIVTEPNVD